MIIDGPADTRPAGLGGGTPECATCGCAGCSTTWAGCGMALKAAWEGGRDVDVAMAWCTCSGGGGRSCACAMPNMELLLVALAGSVGVTVVVPATLASMGPCGLTGPGEDLLGDGALAG